MNDNSNGTGSSGDSSYESEFDDLNGTADRFARLLVDSFPPVPPEDTVWDGIEASIASPDRQAPDTTQAPQADTPGSSSGQWTARRLAPLLAVAAVVMALMGSVFVVQSQRQPAVVAASDGVVRQLADPVSGELAMTVVTAEDGTSLATSASLPALGADETYQLWSVVGDEIVSVGLLGTDPANVEFRIEGEPAVLALTVEVAGGVAVSEATPVAVWQSS
jgi:anti-sigma-K factor RskA